MRSEEEVNAAIERYGDTVRRLCMVHLKNEADTQDIFQTVFLKYVLSSVRFESPEHEKAWLIRVTLNACRDLLKSFFHNRVLPLEAAAAACTSGPEDSGVLQAVLALPPKYKFFNDTATTEIYTAPEIGRILGKNVNTVYTLLNRAKKLLRETLGGEADA